jgi:hypothetical protein
MLSILPRVPYDTYNKRVPDQNGSTLPMQILRKS